MLLCIPGCWMATLSPTSSTPGLPLLIVQWTIGLFSVGGAFGFLRCGVAYFSQGLQFSIWSPLVGRSLCFTIVSVCGSIAFVSPNLNVTEPPDRKSTRLNSSDEWISYA